MTSGCTGCGRRLYYNERVAHAQAFCFPCATARGIERICDRARWHHLRQCASLVERGGHGRYTSIRRCSGLCTMLAEDATG